MEKDSKKCSSKKHKEINAVSYCEICKVYMCNKCQNFHNELCEEHYSYKIDKDNQEISSLYCEEKKHFDALKYYCKNHNKLCCSFCITKIKDEENGQHTNCEVCKIKDIKEEKKAKLKENLKQLEDLSKNIEETINKIKVIYDQISEKKESLKLKVQQIFTKIRNVINDREDELLLEIENKYSNKYIKEELIKKIEKLPNQIKISLEKGKLIDKEFDNYNKLNTIIKDCINIENNIKDINILNEIVERCNDNNNSDIIFYPDEQKEINLFLDSIKYFGKINDSGISKIIDNNEEYIKSLKNWISKDKKFKIELLYRLSDHGKEFRKFHELCDNKGPLLALYHVNDGNKVGIYTPLILDNKSEWKNDMETFIFNLNKNRKYKKIKNYASLYCNSNSGMYTADFGNDSSCSNTMGKIVLYSDQGQINAYYENGSDILPSEEKRKYYDLLEVEVFKISFI